MNELFGSCRFIGEFTQLNQLGEGTFGKVYKAQDKNTGEIVAVKQVKIHDEREGFPITSVREIKLLNELQDHPNIVKFKEVVVGQNQNSIFLIFEYCQIDIANLIYRMNIEKVYFTESEIKCIVLQLLNGIQHMHKQFQIHRDIKLSNILINDKGIVKIADFGLARHYSIPHRPYTPKVVTLWYRAPELLLELDQYSQAIDIWSVGCVLAEFLNEGQPIFAGNNETNQFQLICQLIGYPCRYEWNDYYQLVKKEVRKELEKFSMYKSNNIQKNLKFSDKCLDLLQKMLAWDPNKRISAEKAMLHPYFSENPQPTLPGQIRVLERLNYYTKKNQDQMEKKLKI
ncbi:hypothetical protein IMG5_123230 [Ichthyophthirius multifiliis]|uniref:Cyclin-dependent kinase 2 homolog n=1 Tax=Ichthyophthirius multifiliis TaxID=5932 RepID=G0QVF2_ICHMU|nr:hypothetical protein IMG5_123230 [Ichthyophthirius multifiliis]EGR30809.1 hypothetical protein IMG5_123230 [Ichthyophthirius multifiliis]|eukprot:XP_004032396.1 hypothetical protein IMG5_123230 [Ichthyophthirius multifiliis]